MDLKKRCGIAVRLLQIISLLGVLPTVNAQHRHTAHFDTHVVATGMTDGYQVIIADLNNDQRPDLLAVASGLSELAWFENPTWQRHVITDGLTRPENVAVFDTDGDGIPEIGLVSGFGQNPQTSTGVVMILTHSGDPTDRWEAREIDRIPTSHRVRWADIDGSGQKVLVNAPFVGPNAEAPDFRDDTPIVLYRPGRWQRELITTQEGLIHGLYILGSSGLGRDRIITTGFAGIFANEFYDGEWQRHKIIDGSSMAWPKSGASEFTELHIGRERLMATIEPWHGNEVIVYRPLGETWTRHIIDTDVSLGHSLVTADLDGDGSEELIVADRGEARGAYLYSAVDTLGTSWEKEVLDDDIMASGCVAGDINGDSRVDIACIDRMEELKWYENTGR
jgi:hypothetical protein